MSRPKIDRTAVALRPTTDLLAQIDAEALRTGQSRHGEILALIADGLAARKGHAQSGPMPSAVPTPAKKPRPTPAAPSVKMTMDDVRPKFVSRLKSR